MRSGCHCHYVRIKLLHFETWSILHRPGMLENSVTNWMEKEKKRLWSTRGHIHLWSNNARVWVQLAAWMGQQASCWERSLQEKEAAGHHEVILTWAQFYAAAIYLEPREENSCVCARLFVRMCACQRMLVCVPCVHACVCADRARRWRVMANFRSSYKILTEVFVKYSFVCVKPEGRVGERSRQIAFTPVNMTLEA